MYILKPTRDIDNNWIRNGIVLACDFWHDSPD
jgi:hypothetical protein